MAELPRFEDSQPILQSQEINSGAKGADELAKVFGDVANTTADKATTVLKEQSQAMYLQSVSNLEQVKTSAEINLLQNPDKGTEIAANTRETIELIKQGAYVNGSDRGKLNAYADSTVNDVDLKSAESTVKQTQLMAAFTHYANWPSQLNAYQQALQKDPEQADQLKEAMLSTLKGLVQIRALTPQQAGSGIKSMGDMVNVSADHQAVYGNEGATAKDYHTTMSNPLAPHTASNVNTPINENTGWLVNYHAQDRSFQGVLSDISNRVLPDPQVFDSLPQSERSRAIMAINGVKEADGYINSGAPFSEISSVYAGLSAKGRVLTYQQQSLRNSLGTFIDRINKKDYLGAIGQTPGGGAIIQDYVNNNQAIQNSPLTSENKSKFLFNNNNDFVNRMVSYGYGIHLPPDKIQPIPSGDVAQLENAFVAGNNPVAVLDVLSKYRAENKPWVAQSLKDPQQQTVVQTVSLMGNDVKPSDQLDFIAAQQKGREYVRVNEGQEKSGVSDPKLNGLLAITPGIKAAANLVTMTYDPYRSGLINEALVKSATNYVKYLGEKNNDPLLVNRAQYIKQASDMISTAYPKISGTNYIINPKQIGVTSTEADVLANYINKKGYEYLRDGVNPAVYMLAVDRNPLKMVLSPTNELMAVDGNNKVYFHVPYSTKVMDAAHKLWADEEKQAEQLGTEVNGFRYGAM